MTVWTDRIRQRLTVHRELIVRLLLAALFLGIVAVVSHNTSFFKGAQLDTIYADAASGYSRATIVDKQDGSLTVRIIDGQNAGEIAIVQKGAYLEQQRYQSGDTVVVVDSGAGDVRVTDRWRIPTLTFVVALFFVAIAFIGGKRGVMSAVGLAVSVGVLLGFVVPGVLQGYDTFTVIMIGAAIICATSVYVAHGISRRTTISVVSILLVLIVIALLSWLSVHVLGLSGKVDEMSANLGISHPGISLSGLLAGGIVIATLGMLDDVVTTQVAAVDNILAAKPTMARKELFASGMDIGREHIASLVNTLALAYAGVSFPLIVMYAAGVGYASPILFLNSEFIAQEVTRTVVASLGLLVAVPLSTYAAAVVFTRLRQPKRRLLKK